MHVIRTDEDVRNFKKFSTTLKACIVLLHEKYAYGIDFRFPLRPMCVVFNAKQFANYLLRQMAGRAQRDNQRAECICYYDSVQAAETKLESDLQLTDERAFKDGVRILDSLSLG